MIKEVQKVEKPSTRMVGNTRGGLESEVVGRCDDNRLSEIRVKKDETTLLGDLRGSRKTPSCIRARLSMEGP